MISPRDDERYREFVFTIADHPASMGVELVGDPDQRAVQIGLSLYLDDERQMIDPYDVDVRLYTDKGELSKAPPPPRDALPLVQFGLSQFEFAGYRFVMPDPLQSPTLIEVRVKGERLQVDFTSGRYRANLRS